MLFEERVQVEQVTGKSLRDVTDDIDYLANLHTEAREDRKLTRDLLNGGPEGLTALLGTNFKTSSPPVLNILDAALNRLSQALADLPDLTAPRHTKKDSEPAREAAEKRERIVRGYDEAARLELAMGQNGLWLPGYAFTPWVLKDKFSGGGDPYPVAELRDPFDCYPSEWGPQQQPTRMAIIRQVPRKHLMRIYPTAREVLKRNASGVVGANLATGSWEGNTYSDAVEVAEYYDLHGTWTVLRDVEFLLDFTPNPLESGPAFVVMKRFSFDKLKGHYSHTIGLMAAIAKMNLLTEIAMTDNVFAETNVMGSLARGRGYKKGRNAINWFDPSARVEKPTTNIPPQTWQQIDRLERQFRIQANYPVTQDAESPNSFVTGRGLDELSSAVSREFNQYQTVIRYGLQDLDAKRLEWDEKCYPRRRKVIFAHEHSDGEQYRPSTDIKGRYQTTRKYGLLAGFEDANRIIGMAQLKGMDALSRRTVIENTPGISDAAEEEKRVDTEKARNVAYETLLGLAGQGDPRALFTVVDLLPPSDLKTQIEKFFSPDTGDEPSPGQAAEIAPPAAEMEDAATVLSRLSLGGGAEGGTQVMGAL